MFEFIDILEIISAAIPSLLIFSATISAITKSSVKRSILASVAIYFIVLLFLIRAGG
tara:strand:- start:558 stop:728 length:171 start_codon:yes stop_codon:yes gene_type:complete